MGSCGVGNIITDSIEHHRAFYREQALGAQHAAQQAQSYSLQELRDRLKSMEQDKKPLFKINQEPRSFMKIFKSYLEDHRDTIFTLVLILLVDHYVFKGAFAETIKSAFSKIIDKAHKKIDAIEVKP